MATPILSTDSTNHTNRMDDGANNEYLQNEQLNLLNITNSHHHQQNHRTISFKQ